MRVLIEMERLEAQGEAMVWCLACTTEQSGVFTAFPHPDVRLIYPILLPCSAHVPDC